MNKEVIFLTVYVGAQRFFDFSYQSVVYPVPSGLEDGENEVVYFVLGVLYVILLYAAYQLIYRPLKVNSRIKAAFARGDSYEDIYHMPYLLNEEEQNMLRRFYALLDKSELITVSKKKSEYLALQNQINPHFLYNTLEGIRQRR